MLAGVHVCVLCAVSSNYVLVQYKNYYCICCVALLSEFESTFVTIYFMHYSYIVLQVCCGKHEA